MYTYTMQAPTDPYPPLSILLLLFTENALSHVANIKVFWEYYGQMHARLLNSGHLRVDQKLTASPKL